MAETFFVCDPDAPGQAYEIPVASVKDLQERVAMAFRQPGFLRFKRPGSEGAYVMVTPHLKFEDLPNKLQWMHQPQGAASGSGQAGAGAGAGMAAGAPGGGQAGAETGAGVVAAFREVSHALMEAIRRFVARAMSPASVSNVSQCNSRTWNELMHALSGTYAIRQHETFPCCLSNTRLRQLVPEPSAPPAFEWPVPGNEADADNMLKLRDHLQSTLAPVGVVVAAVHNVEWLSACFVATDTGRTINVGGGGSKTDLIFILQAGFEKLQASGLNGVELSHVLPYIIALYEAKVPDNLRSALGACKRQAILEFIAVNNMDGAQGRQVPVVMGDGNTQYLVHTSYGASSSEVLVIHVAGPSPSLTQPLGTHALAGLHRQAWRPAGPGSAQRVVGSPAQVAGSRVQGAAGGVQTRAATSRSALGAGRSPASAGRDSRGQHAGRSPAPAGRGNRGQRAGCSPAPAGRGSRGQHAGSSPAQAGMSEQATSSSSMQAASTNDHWFLKAALEIAAAEARAHVPGGGSSQVATNNGAGPTSQAPGQTAAGPFGAGAGQAAAGWAGAGAGPQSGAGPGQAAAPQAAAGVGSAAAGPAGADFAGASFRAVHQPTGGSSVAFESQPVSCLGVTSCGRACQAHTPVCVEHAEPAPTASRQAQLSQRCSQQHTPASSESSWDEGPAEAARDNAFGQIFVRLFQDPVWREMCGIKPGEVVSVTPPTPDDYAASFRFYLAD